MREIKFRGKRIDTGEWVFGDLIHERCGTCIQYITSKIPVGIGAPERKPISERHKAYIDPATVGQYTGKTVKTGQVCQDDIGKSIDGLFLIVWDEEKAAFIMQFLDGSGERLYLEEMWEDSEIIGNIHDNPELLGGAANA